MPEKSYSINPEDNGQRLDKFLIAVQPEISRSQIQKQIKSNSVLVNGKPAKVHRFLKTGDTVSFAGKLENRDQKTLMTEDKTGQQADAHRRAVSASLQSPGIIFENNDYLIIEKPVGLLVHATEKNEVDTLVGWLLKRYPQIEKVGEEKYRAGIIHRLDKDVSGIMVVAKTNDTYFHLKDQFKERKVKKEYLALVYGRIKDPEGEIDLPIGRGKDGQFVAHPKEGGEKFQEDDRFARTRYQVIEYVKEYSLLKVQILTGRTHQIRAHLTAFGHPILGDQMYKPKKKFFHLFSKKIKVVDLPRIFLHSHRIGFYDHLNQWQEFESPLPAKLNEILTTYKK